jgi:hypothetical protein
MGVQLYKEMVAAIKRQRIVEEAMRQVHVQQTYLKQTCRTLASLPLA